MSTTTKCEICGDEFYSRLEHSRHNLNKCLECIKSGASKPTEQVGQEWCVGCNERMAEPDQELCYKCLPYQPETPKQEGCKNTTCSRYDSEESENCMMNGQYQISEVCPDYGGVKDGWIKIEDDLPGAGDLVVTMFRGVDHILPARFVVGFGISTYGRRVAIKWFLLPEPGDE